MASSKNLHCHHSRKFCSCPGYGSLRRAATLDVPTDFVRCRDPRPEEEPEASQSASAVAESSTVSAEATAPLESHHPGSTMRLVPDESDPVPEDKPELAQTVSAVADRSTFGILIKQA